MLNIKKLGNNQLGIYYEKIDRELDIVQTEILEQLKNIFNDIPDMNYPTYNDPKKFKEFCSPYRETIKDEYKKNFIEMMQQQEELKKEIKSR